MLNRDALIVDMRNNQGCNIDSWVLEKLVRKPWMYWQPRVGEPYWNMPFAFRGPMTTLINEWSSSHGEAFPEGSRRLGLGKLIGTRHVGRRDLVIVVELAGRSRYRDDSRSRCVRS